MTKEIFKEGVEAIFQVKTYSEWENTRKGYCVEFQLHQGQSISFKQLNQLSDLLGTEHINFTEHRDSYHYSSYTQGSGTPAKFEAFHCKIPEAKG